METKKIFLTGILMLTLILAVTMISASQLINITSPTSATRSSGTTNVTVNTNVPAAINVTCYYHPLGTATNISAVLVTITNTTADQVEFTNGAVAISTLADTMTYNISCVVANTTYGDTTPWTGGQAVVSNVTFDSTSPTCTSSLPIGEETLEYLSPLGINPTSGATDAASRLSYWWKLWDPSRISQDTARGSAPTSFSGEDFDEIGDFLLELVVSDSAGNNATCSNITISIKGSDDVDVTPGLGGVITSSVKKGKSTVFIAAAGVLVVLIAISLFLVLKLTKR